MKPRTTIAIQFALWAFFFSRIIPFSGSFLLPIVWIYDRKVFAGYLAVEILSVARFLPGAISFTFGLPGFPYDQIPSWILPLFPIMVLGFIAINLTFDSWVTAWFLKRKIRRLAPDLEVIRQHS